MGPKQTEPPAGLLAAEIARIAGRIDRARTRPSPDDPRDAILAVRHEVPSADEARVIAALRTTRRMPRRVRERG